MRGALELSGVVHVDVTPGKRRFWVTYDPTQITIERMLAVLEREREPAKVVPAGPQDIEFVLALERQQAHRPSELSSVASIAAEDEPGAALVIHGRLLGEDGRTPVAQEIVFAYHSDREGRYDRPGSPAHSWRLRGWARTDSEGRFEFRTIRPGAYPSRREPAHVHLNVFTARARYHAVLLFEDDELIPAAEREDSKRAGEFGWVCPVRREGSTQHVDITIRLTAQDAF